MNFIASIIGYIVLVPAAYKGISSGYKYWNNSIYSVEGNVNLVQLVIYCVAFTFLYYILFMIPVYIFFKIWWVALIVGGIIFFVYKLIKNKTVDNSDDEKTEDEE